MKVLVLGAGMMGSAVAYDLAHSDGVSEVFLADIDLERAQRMAAQAGENVSPLKLDLAYYDDVLKAMKGIDVAVGATSYNHNYMLTEAAIASHIHFCDLGGNMDVVYRQMSLNDKARKESVCILPNCGLAPGLACIVAAGAARRFQSVDEIHLRVGGLPQHPLPPLNYQLVFSAEGLINEYIEPAEVIRNGVKKTVASLADVESIDFPSPFGTLEAFNTSGGISTLPSLFAGKVRELDYKTIRYKGHAEKMKTLLDLGFASSEPVTVGSAVLTAREYFEAMLRKRLPADGPDVVLMRVQLKGNMSGATKTLAYDMIDYYDTRLNMTSMMRTTAFPTSIAAQLVVRGEVTTRGVIPPEQCIPLGPMLEELKKRNILLHETLS